MLSTPRSAAAARAALSRHDASTRNGVRARRLRSRGVVCPAQDTYREISSVSVCGDFQAGAWEAMSARPRGKIQKSHTLMAPGVAVGRAIVAVMENLPARRRLGRSAEAAVYMGGLAVIGASCEISSQTMRRDAPGICGDREIAKGFRRSHGSWSPTATRAGQGTLPLARELMIEEPPATGFAIVGGSPADCVVAGATHIPADRTPDVVLSGVNAGRTRRMSSMSGTAAGREGANCRAAIGIALSQGQNYERRHDIVLRQCGAIRSDRGQRILEAHRGREPATTSISLLPPAEVSGVRVVAHRAFQLPFS